MPAPGAGQASVRCTVCGEPVTKEQMEFEVQFAFSNGEAGLDKFHIHIRCFAAWEFERTNGGAHT